MINFPIKVKVLFILIFCYQSIQAQKIGNILKKASQKIEKGVSDILEDKISEKIAEIALNKVNTQLDSIFQEAYSSDSTSTSSTRSYEEFLGSIDESQKVNATYSFDLSHKLKELGPNGKEIYSTQYFTKDGNAFGIQTEDALILLDAENEIMVTYNTKDKTAFAFGKKFIQLGKDMVPSDLMPGEIKKVATGSKQILGYNCDKYNSQSSDGSNYDLYITKSFLNGMENPYKGMAKVFMQDELEASFNEIQGLVMESIITDKKGDITQSSVIAFDKSTFTISKSEYNFGTK